MLLKTHVFKSASEVQLLQSGNDYFDTLEKLIEDAIFSIHIQFYIFKNDITGKRILEKLIASIKRGVEVYLVVDGYASKDFDNTLVSQLKENGIWVKRFAPIHLKQFKIGRRLHHKIVLVDESIALVGGINIADDYSGFNDKKEWLDLAVLVSGQIVHDIKKVCMAIWPKRIQKKWKRQPQPKLQKGNIFLRLLQNDWWRRRIEISSNYNEIFRECTTELTIVASYFLPGFTKRRLLKKAADRGVKITLITGQFSDVPLMRFAMKYMYGLLLKNNVIIYEWNKSILHAKLAMADSNWVTIGSYNLNALSDYGSLEANIEIKNAEFTQHTKTFLSNIIKEGCIQINAEQFFENTNLLKQALRWISYKLLRALLFILFILMNRDRFKNNS